MLLAQLSGFVQTFGMIFVFFGDKLFSMLGMFPPPWFNTVKENKMLAFGAIFMFNTVAQNLVSTGAFEVTYNGKTLYSKLKTGQMPNGADIVNLLEARGLERL